MTRSLVMLGFVGVCGLVPGCSNPTGHTITVATVTSPAGAGSAEPHLARGADNTIVLSWLEPDEDGVALRYSSLGPERWQPARTVARGDDWFVNWADFPSVTPITSNLWAAHWLAKRPGGVYAYDVAIVLSQDGGQSWSEPVKPHTDNTPTEHRFVSLFPWQAGVGALWLDGRNMTADDQASDDIDRETGGMTLRSTVVMPDGTLTNAHLVDDLVCDCCQTDVALGPSGPIAVYRNRTAEEIRDIYVARAVSGRWEAGRPIAQDNWDIAGCPVNGPAIATDGTHVAVAWFTAANDVPRVRLASSVDAAATFSTPVDIDVEKPIGRVDVELLGNGDAIVSWIRIGADGKGDLCLRRLSTSGELGPTHIVARVSKARWSGFPQMMRDGDDLVLAWTDKSGEASAVQTVRIDGL